MRKFYTKSCLGILGSFQVYRLITCGTVEEKIYRKQVFKGGLSRSSTKEGSQFRYFSQQVTLVTWQSRRMVVIG